MSEVVSKSEVPTMYIEVLDKGESGYVRDDTAGTAFEEKIDCPGLTFIPNTGKMAEPMLNEDGKPTGRFKNINIRYIKDCPFIKEEDQKKNGWEKNKIPSVDTIQISKGKSIIKDEGDTALFEYLTKVFYNTSAPNRPKSAKGLFKVVEIEQKVSTLNEVKFLQGKAICEVEKLALKVNKSWKFKESEIDNILTALSLFGGDNYSEKINVLTREAEARPENFLNVVYKLKGVVMTEITQALDISLIVFEGSVAQYVNDKKILATVPAEYKAQSKKIEALAEILKTPEYASAYQEFKVKFEIEQEKQLKK